MTLLRKPHGFSVLELMIAVGVLGLMAAGSFSLFQDLMVKQNTFIYKTESNSFLDETRDILRNETACTNTFQNLLLEPGMDVAVNQLRNEAGVNPFDPAGTKWPMLPGDEVRVQQIRAIDLVDKGNNEVEFLAEFTLQSQKQVVGSRDLVRNIRIQAQKDQANLLTSCSVQSLSQSSQWEQNTVGPNHVASTQLNVGIGTSTPQAKLDVKGGKINGQFECRRVMGNETWQQSVANCAADEWAIGGGTDCIDAQDWPYMSARNNPQYGFIHTNRVLPNRAGWEGDCFRSKTGPPGTPDTSRAVAYAICCKK